MRALMCHHHGPIDDLTIDSVDDPTPDGNEIVIDVAAAGINFPDLLVIAGTYQDKTPPPFIPGNEASGVVSAVGPDVQHFKLGDRVIVSPRGGAFAEKCKVSENLAMPLAANMSFEQGAGFAVTYGTSYHALKDCAKLQPGETVLVLGAAGGVGIAAVQLAKAMGATVIAAASSTEKIEFALQAGADHGINYLTESLRDSVKAQTNGNGVDVVYDPVGGDYAQQALRSLAWHGRYLVVGFASGDIPQLPANMALLKEASIVGVWWGTWAARHPQEFATNMRELAGLVGSGKIDPGATASFALQDFKEAFRSLSERRALGKVVFTTDHD